MKAAKQRNFWRIPVRFFCVDFKGKCRRMALRHGEKHTMSSFVRTSEGWESEYQEIVLDGRLLQRRIRTDGRDCDGRLTTYHELYCRVSERSKVRAERSVTSRPPRERYPLWQTKESCQYDEYASLMGY